MRSLFDAGTAAEIEARVAQVSDQHTRQWGRMNLAQALAHCAGVLELALGDRRPPRALLGRILGRVFKRLMIGSDAPLRRNTPTLPYLTVLDRRELHTERDRLLTLIERFAAGGPARCTVHPHPFFGPLTPQEWAVFEYKHLDHHLRQFGA
ncbi:MAG TPA: DUF1569 domain-containing protein [Gemmatimonadaceae bacterium]|nr:DUF1569 domain-containing protein [Gemmatimonadaceae bacterium]